MFILNSNILNQVNGFQLDLLNRAVRNGISFLMCVPVPYSTVFVRKLYNNNVVVISKNNNHLVTK